MLTEATLDDERSGTPEITLAVLAITKTVVEVVVVEWMVVVTSSVDDPVVICAAVRNGRMATSVLLSVDAMLDILKRLLSDAARDGSEIGSG